MKFISTASEKINHVILKGLVAIQTGVALPAFAADSSDFKMPSVTLPGASEDSDPVDMAINTFKFMGQMVMWVLVLIAGFVVVKNIVKSVNKVRRDEEGQWGAVVGDIIGNVVILVFLIALATWVSGFLGTTEA
jgi:hypothetical protein